MLTLVFLKSRGAHKDRLGIRSRPRYRYQPRHVQAIWDNSKALLGQTQHTGEILVFRWADADDAFGASEKWIEQYELWPPHHFADGRGRPASMCRHHVGFAGQE